MSYIVDPSETSTSFENSRSSKKISLNAEIIRALTPIFLATIGGVIGIATLVKDANPSGFGLASTAIAGAAGLAQPREQKKELHPK